MTAATRISLVRLLMGPLFFLAFWNYGVDNELGPSGSILHPLFALGIILASEATDLLDGYLARKHGAVSPLGALLDRFADSLARLTFLTCFWALELVPSWMVLLAYYHDASGFFLRNLARGQNLELRRRWTGRIMEGALVAVTPIIVLGMLAWHLFQPRLSWAFVRDLAWWSVLGVAALSVISAVDYVIGNAEALKQIPR
jgi:phosphatidylglycerophosphate synthase